MRISYLISRYPAISHTFIHREVAELRNLGFEIQVASINAPDRAPESMPEAERREFDRTFYVKGAGLRGALPAHLRVLLTRPRSYCKGLAFALGLGNASLPDTLLCLFYFVEAVMLGRWMTKNKSSHLHVHFATQAATVALILKQMFPMTFSITVHGPDEFFNVKEHFLSRKMEHVSFVCAIGQYAQSQLMRISDVEHWPKIEISPLGVDSEEFRPAARARDRGALKVACVGRLVPEKGQMILLQAFHGILRKRSAIELNFVGDGPDRQSMESFVQVHGLTGSVHFLGAQPSQRVREVLGDSDIFVLPSFAEGIPVALMEAMAMEIPCVTTCITGIPELIEHGKSGLLVMPSDCAALTAAIESLACDPELRRRLGKAARIQVMERYELRRNVDRLARIFKRRLNQPAARAMAAVPEAFGARPLNRLGTEL